MFGRLAVWSALALGCAPPASSPPVANTSPAQPPIDEHDALVTIILQRYLAQPDSLPDHGLLPATGPVYIAAEIGDPPHHRVHVAALPPGRFAIRSLADLQADADRTNANIAYIRFGDLTLSDPTHARINVGVELLLPKQSTAIKMCCCSSVTHWEKHGTTWSPGNIRETICS